MSIPLTNRFNKPWFLRGMLSREERIQESPGYESHSPLSGTTYGHIWAYHIQWNLMYGCVTPQSPFQVRLETPVKKLYGLEDVLVVSTQ